MAVRVMGDTQGGLAGLFIDGRLPLPPGSLLVHPGTQPDYSGTEPNPEVKN
jgi:hypothetical protein